MHTHEHSYTHIVQTNNEKWYWWRTVLIWFILFHSIDWRFCHYLREKRKKTSLDTMPMTKSGLEWFQIVCVGGGGGGEEGGCSHFCWGVVLIVLQSLLREGMGWAREWVGKMWASACDSLCGWVVLSVCAAETCRNWLVKIFAVSKLTWCLTSPESMRLVRDGGKGVWRWGERETVYLLLHRMTSALRWGEMRAILMFHNCEGQSHKTVSTDHYLWRKKESQSRFEPRSFCLSS